MTTVRRTPDSRFDNLAGYPFSPNMVDVAADDGVALAMHYVDEGPADAAAVLCLHGQPTWSYLYRKMIPIFTAAGHRVVAPDFIGFGRSDKPMRREDYTYARHVEWLVSFLDVVDLNDITLVCQDWGGLIGLRAASIRPDRFARIVAANTALPDAEGIDEATAKVLGDRMRAYYDGLPVHRSAAAMGAAMVGDGSGMGFLHWVEFCAEARVLRVSDVVRFSSGGTLGDDEARAYDAPFPDDSYMAGARQFPSLVPIMPDNVAIAANRAAWRVFETWDKPFLTAFSDRDPVTAGRHERFQRAIPGARNQKHVTIEGAGHFLQEDKPGELAKAVLDFVDGNPT